MKLDLRDILRGHTDDTFYSPIFGDVKITFFGNHIRMSPVNIYEEEETKVNIPIGPDGRHADYPTECLLWPEKELYHMYVNSHPEIAWARWMDRQRPMYVMEHTMSSWFDGQDGQEPIELEDRMYFRFRSQSELEDFQKEIKTVLSKYII